MHDGPRCRQAVLGDSRLGPWAREVDPKSLTIRPGSERPQFDQVSRATRAHTQSPAWSSRCPGRLRHSSEVLQGRPAVLGLSRLCLRAPGVHQHAGDTRASARGQRVRPVISGDSGQVRGLALSTMSPRLLGPLPKALQYQADIPGDIGPAPRARGVVRLSRYTRTCVRGPVGWTSFSG